MKHHGMEVFNGTLMIAQHNQLFLAQVGPFSKSVLR